MPLIPGQSPAPLTCPIRGGKEEELGRGRHSAQDSGHRLSGSCSSAGVQKHRTESTAPNLNVTTGIVVDAVTRCSPDPASRKAGRTPWPLGLLPAGSLGGQLLPDCPDSHCPLPASPHPVPISLGGGAHTSLWVGSEVISAPVLPAGPAGLSLTVVQLTFPWPSLPLSPSTGRNPKRTP